MDRILQFGKYKGRTIPAVIDDDPQYIQWAYNNLERFQLTEEEKYLLFSRLKDEGLIDGELLADISELPPLEFKGEFDVERFLQIIEPISRSPLLDLRPQIKTEYNDARRFKDSLKSLYNRGNYYGFSNRVDNVMEILRRIKKKCSNLQKRPNQAENVQKAAGKLGDQMTEIIQSAVNFFQPYLNDISSYNDKLEERGKVVSMKHAVQLQEEQKAERNTAVDKHPYKDIDETFLVKLDDILGKGEYKIRQCVFRIDLYSNKLSAIMLRQLREVFGESKIEVSDRNGDALSVYLTQNIEPVTSGQSEKNYIEAVNNFLRGLKSEQREQLFSLGKEESKKIFDKVINYYSEHGEFPAFSQLFDDDTWEKLTVDDIKKWLDNMSDSDTQEIYNFLTTDWKKKYDGNGSENTDNIADDSLLNADIYGLPDDKELGDSTYISDISDDPVPF